VRRARPGTPLLVNFITFFVPQRTIRSDSDVCYPATSNFSVHRLPARQNAHGPDPCVDHAYSHFLILISSVGFSSQITPTVERLVDRNTTPFVDPFALPSISSRPTDERRGNDGRIRAYNDGRHLVSAPPRANMHSRALSSSYVQGNWSETGSNTTSPIASSSALPGPSPLWQPRQFSHLSSQRHTHPFPRSTWHIDEVSRQFSRKASLILPGSHFFGLSHACTRRSSSSRTDRFLLTEWVRSIRDAF
jgi:hypothetical protein